MRTVIAISVAAITYLIAAAVVFLAIFVIAIAVFFLTNGKHYSEPGRLANAAILLLPGFATGVLLRRTRPQTSVVGVGIGVVVGAVAMLVAAAATFGGTPEVADIVNTIGACLLGIVGYKLARLRSMRAVTQPAIAS